MLTEFIASFWKPKSATRHFLQPDGNLIPCYYQLRLHANVYKKLQAEHPEAREGFIERLIYRELGFDS